MGLRINTNIAAINAARTLRGTTRQLNTTLERLASGLRINRAADDAAGLAISEGFRTVIRGSAVAQRNSQDGISLVQTAEGALSEATNILQRMRELAVQAANGTQSTANRESLGLEVKQLLQQLDDIAFDTEFNGLCVLSSAQTITLQAGFRAGQTIEIAVAGASTANLGVTTVSLSTMEAAVSSLAILDAAIQSVSQLRATFGAVQNRLEFTMNSLAITEENASASDSALRDADIATETIQFTRTQILISSGTAVLAQANLVPQTALQLLGG